MKKIFGIIFGLLICIFVSVPAFAENFYITNYDVNINVDKNKTAHVNEVIDVYFTNSSHGIYRDIPLKGNFITNIKVSEQNNVTTEGNLKRIKIGNPNAYVNGNHQYIISYDYNFSDNKNEFYFNIIGTQWGTEIRKTSFSVTMPEKFDSNKAGLSIGREGTAGFNGGAQFFVNENTLSGYTTQTLPAYNGITLRVEVPKGYFNHKTNYIPMVVISIMLALTVISWFIWYKYGKDMPVIPVVTFYPPKNYNSAEVELMYKGKASEKGIVSLIFYLANKGYLKISDSMFGFEIEKVKEYDGNNPVEKAFMNALIPGQKTSQIELSVSRNFYRKCQVIIENINKARNKIFVKDSISPGLIFLMSLCLLGLCVLTLFSMFNFDILRMLSMGFASLFPLIAISVLIGFFVSGRKSIATGIFIIIWSAFFGGIPFLTLLPSIVMNSSTIPAIFTGVIGLVVSSICLYHLPQRNDFGNKMLGEVLGLKQFIEVAEKYRLEKLLQENPSYVYDVLPYAYVLDVSDKWIKQFESIMTLQPEWYSGNVLNVHNFNTFTSNMSSVSVPSTSNGGVSSSSGGGGHSGGGGGGGGGGSW
mgnify:CR=1 FL=1